MSENEAEVVVLTGATKGVGRAIAERFAREGAHIALLARGREGLDSTAKEVERLGGRALPIPTDVADYGAVEAAATQAEEAFGPIDVWINDAMTTVFAFFEDIEPDEFRRATEVTYLGAVWGTHVALKRMAPRGRGTIVQVGSAMAYRGIPLQAPYCGAKHAMKGFWESVRSEIEHKGLDIHMPMVQLPGLNTPQFEHCRSKMDRKPMPVPPIYQPEVAARAVVFAASHPERKEYWVGGSTAATILANKVAPGILDRYLARTGYDSQQTSEPQPPGRPGNLDEADDSAGGADFGAHGEFDAKAHPRSAQLWLSQHRRLAAASAAAAGAAVAALTRRRAG
jgi:NAD(P)-dependent dehydrogenase (short-subunit alcohol dehydrogenase family)